MPLHRLLQTEQEGGVFEPEDVLRMVAAYEGVLKLLRPKDCTDPVKELIAKKIIETARQGEEDPARICASAMKSLGLPLNDP
jgi:hypothetical protein